MNLLQKEGYLLFDGAMGTYYASQKGTKQACELANMNDKDTIMNIHREYIAAGAMAIKTNTFGANRFALDCDDAQREKILRSGWDLASMATQNTEVQVFADIGPISYNESENVDIVSEYKRILDIFISCGATNFIFETFAHYTVLLDLAAYIKLQVPHAFIITSFAVYPDGYTREGIFSEDIRNELSKSSLVDALGFNCVCGPSHMLKLLGDFEINGKPISIMPNAGYPLSDRGRTVYIDNSEYFSQKMLEIKNAGVKILGGCCGTTPSHIKATAVILSSNKSKYSKEERISIKDNRVFKQQNEFEQILSNGYKPILVEIDPPIDTDFEHMMSSSMMLKQAGADMITIADSPLAKARADSCMMAAKIKREVNIPTIPHITCRDKNLLGIKAALLGLNIEGIRNVLLITGDPVAQVERASIKGVFSLNSTRLANYITSLNSNIFESSPFKLGAAINVNAPNFDAELKRCQAKIENGVDFFLSQPAYTQYAVNNVKKAVETLEVPLFAGIMPLVGYKNALFVHNEIPGIELDEQIVERFRDKDREESEKIGIELAGEIINEIKDLVAGYYLITPLKRTRVICEIIRKIKSDNNKI